MNYSVRGATVTALATATTGTASSLLAGDADYFHDMIEVTLSSNTTVTTNIALVNDGTTIRTLQLGAGTTTQLFFDETLRQLTKNTPWNIDMEDVTGTSVFVGATFIKRTNA